jgi:cysteine sulfinate desulfinase/cysteine desulfurase-like protein
MGFAAGRDRGAVRLSVGRSTTADEVATAAGAFSDLWGSLTG